MSRERTHTPGRLRVDVTVYEHMIAEIRSDAEERGIAQVWATRDEWPNGPRTPRGFADAERLAACWNACEGMVDPEATITALRSELVRAEAIISAWVGEDATVPQQIRAALALADPSGGEQ